MKGAWLSLTFLLLASPPLSAGEADFEGPPASGVSIPNLFPEEAASRAAVLIGDMLFDADDVSLEEDLSATASRFSLVLRDSRAWEKGRLPVSFDPAVTADQQRQFFEACAVWEQVAAVRCVPRNREWTHLQVVAGSGCSSSIGPGRWAWTARRTMTLGKGCWSRSILVHELGHAFGLRHEHQRADRDRFIRVLWDNVDPGHRHSYALIRGATDGSPYDFDSIMHYSDATFSKGAGLKTYVGRPGLESKAASAGRAWKPSTGDAEAMARRYGRP